MERVVTRREKKMEAAPMQQDMPTSPWTETFQNAESFMTPASRPTQAGQQDQAQRHADSDADRPTQDALSTIFNGV